MSWRLSEEAAAELLAKQVQKLGHAKTQGKTLAEVFQEEEKKEIKKLGHANQQDLPADEGPESKLAGKVMKWAKDNGFPHHCNRQTIRARGLLTPGWPD